MTVCPTRRRRVAAAFAGSFLLSQSACREDVDPLPWVDSSIRAAQLAAPAPGRSATNPRNVVLVSLDTLRADHVSAYGYERPTSPNLDRLAAEGILFEQAFSHAPHTAQSHMSLFTSLYPGEHGVHNFQDGPPVRLDDEIPTLAELLQSSGYRTRGVVSGGNISGSLGFDRGFDRYDELNRHPRLFPAALEALRELAATEGPFFLFVHTYQAHDPYVPPPEFAGLFSDPSYDGSLIGTQDELARLSDGEYEGQHRAFWDSFDRERPGDLRQLVAQYDAVIRATDGGLGALLAELEALGLEAETAVVVLSDHGEEFAEHGGFVHHQLYQEVLHVPLVLRFPGLASGVRVQRRVRLIDVLPTITDYLGIEAPDHTQGESMLPLISDPVSDGASERPLFAQLPSAEMSALYVGNWKALARPPHVGRRSFEIGRWAFHIERTTNRSKLFDLKTDAGEVGDQSEQNPARMGEMLTRIEALERSFDEARGELKNSPVLLEEDTRAQLEALGYLQ
jgi:arylsulfatase A-like enzyme